MTSHLEPHCPAFGSPRRPPSRERCDRCVPRSSQGRNGPGAVRWRILRRLAQLGVTTWNKRPPTWTTVRRWARWHGFPLTPGTRWGRNYMSAVTTTHAPLRWRQVDLESHETLADAGLWE